MTPTPWRVERGFGNSRIIAADGSIVAVDISQADAEAIVAALAVAATARTAMAECSAVGNVRPEDERRLCAALDEYAEATR